MFERELRSPTCYCTSPDIRPFLSYIENARNWTRAKSNRPSFQNGYPSLLYLFCFPPTRIYPSIYPSTSPFPRSPPSAVRRTTSALECDANGPRQINYCLTISLAPYYYLSSIIMRSPHKYKYKIFPSLPQRYSHSLTLLLKVPYSLQTW